MTDRDKSDKGKPRYHGDQAIIDRNVEQSRELIASRSQGDSDVQLDEIVPTDPENTDEFAPPGQTNVPAGGTTGPNASGGSSNRHKPT